MSSSEEQQLRSETPGAVADNDAAGISGASRRSGVIWTNEARNDMFARREKGEGWESICKDYPSRSRHAMQQQYSMMKKQKAMEAGTWMSNRRGRKRKQPLAPGLMGLQRRESGLDTEHEMSVTPSDFEIDDGDEMMVDDLDMGTPQPEFNNPAIGGVQGVLDFNRDQRMPGRPSPLSRSATDPAPVPAPRGRGRGRGGRIASGLSHADHNPPTLAPKGFTPVNAAEPYDIKPAKRTLHDASSVSPAAKRQRGMAEGPGAEEDKPDVDVKDIFSKSSILMSQDTLVEFFRDGVKNFEAVKKAIDEEHRGRDMAMQDANNRANRRIREYEDRAKMTDLRHKSDVRILEEEQKEQLGGIRDSYEERIRALEADLIIARGTRRPASDVKPTQAPAQGGADPIQGVTGDATREESDLMKLITALEELRGRFESEQQRRKHFEQRCTTLEQQQLATVQTKPDAKMPQEVVPAFKQLEIMIKSLDAEALDLTPRAVSQRLQQACVQSDRLASFILPPGLAPPLPVAAYTPSLSLSGPPTVAPIPQGVPPNIARPLMHHSASPSPAPMDRLLGPAPTSHPGLHTPPDPPFDQAAFDKPQRSSGPMALHSIMSPDPCQQPVPPPPPPPPPPQQQQQQHILPPMNHNHEMTPHVRPLPHPMVAPQQSHPTPQPPGPEHGQSSPSLKT